jgi:3alpha(or 20beta)-hydroxysteroid dehydrogenase
MDRLAGQVAIVTGAARGMGASHARMLAGHGAKVVLADVLDAEGQRQADELGDAARYVHLDVTSEADWQAALAVTTEAFGPPTVLVNNAGINSPSKDLIGDLRAEEFQRTINVNLFGTFLGLKVAGGAMARAGHGGSVINVSSVGGLHGAAGSAAYISSKWAVRGLSKTAAVEYGPAGVRVNTIFPGLIDTPMIADVLPGVAPGSYGALGRTGKPEEISAVVVFLASDEASFCTGGEFSADGGRTTSFAQPAAQMQNYPLAPRIVTP